MSSNKFASQFGPPPQPKVLKIEPPKHTVPDVTLLFDSSDSFMWRAGAPKNNDIVSHVEKRISPGIKFSSLYDNENIPFTKDNVHELSALASYKKFPEQISENTKMQKEPPVQITNKAPYNPEVYKSPVLCPQKKIISSDILGISGNNGEKCEREEMSREYNEKVKVMENKQNYLQSVNESFVSSLKYHGYNQNHFHGNIKIAKNAANSSLTNNVKECIVEDLSKEKYSNSPVSRMGDLNEYNSSKIKIDKQVLRVLEEQKLQIIKLQDVVEKVLVNQINVNDSSNKHLSSDNQHCCNCNHTSAVEPENKKVAIVQTSFIENRPQTRTIATNTDLTMEDITSLITLKNDASFKQIGERRSNFPKTIQRDNLNETPNRLRARSKYMDAYGGEMMQYSNCRSLSKEFVQPVPLSSNIVCDCKEYQGYDGKVTEQPCMKDMAHDFNQRYSNVKNSSDDLQQEEVNNLTCYNNIMINIQQVMQHNDQANELTDENGYRVNKDSGVKQVEQQLQNFGISFLDPVTLQNKSVDNQHDHGLPSMQLYQNHYLETAMKHHPELAFPSRNQDRPTLEFQNRRKQIIFNRNQANYQEENSVYSHSTLQFFRKHGLKE